MFLRFIIQFRQKEPAFHPKMDTHEAPIKHKDQILPSSGDIQQSFTGQIRNEGLGFIDCFRLKDLDMTDTFSDDLAFEGPDDRFYFR